MREKSLQEYLALLQNNGLAVRHELTEAAENEPVRYISYSSLDVKPGTLFICKGRGFRPQYLKEAIEKGVICYIAEEEIINDFPAIIVSDVRKAISDVSAFFFDSVWNRMKLIGVTGTKGKSTTVTFVKAILDSYCQSLGEAKPGFVSSVYIYDGENTYKQIDRMTTPETLELHQILAKCAGHGCRYAIVETSSQALKYRRTEALAYKVGCLLNIGLDHIADNEHPDMEDYIAAKLKIFDQCRVACLNLDMDEEYLERARQKAASCKKTIVFGTREERVLPGEDFYQPRDVRISGLTVDFKVTIDGQEEEIHVAMGGRHNLLNALAAVAITASLGVPAEHIKKGLAAARVAGRMEIYALPDKRVDVIVDSAHNQMSYQAVVDAAHEIYPDRKVLFLISCVGGKSKNRRREVAEIANEGADRIIITEDWCFGEDPMQIFNEIKSYIRPDKDVEIIPDRAEAVRRAVAECGDDWVVLLTGFGVNDYQRLQCTKEGKMSDIILVEEYIRKHS